MARTISAIYDDLITEKNTMANLTGLQPAVDDTQTLLADLTTTSKVAIWRLILFVQATGIFAHETIFDQHEAAVQLISDTAIPGTQLWMQERSLEFQYGDTLQVVDGAVEYAAIDLTKRIVTNAAVVEGGGQVRIKVAKTVATLPAPLAAAELLAFQAYIDQIKFAGMNTAIISRVADLTKLIGRVVYDPLVLTAAGEDINNAGVFPVEDAVNGYLQGLPFNGVFRTTEMIDAIQAAIGVIDFTDDTLEVKFGLLPYSAIDIEYLADAGHMAIDPAFPLSTNLTYQLTAF